MHHHGAHDGAALSPVFSSSALMSSSWAYFLWYLSHEILRKEIRRPSLTLRVFSLFWCYKVLYDAACLGSSHFFSFSTFSASPTFSTATCMQVPDFLMFSLHTVHLCLCSTMKTSSILASHPLVNLFYFCCH